MSLLQMTTVNSLCVNIYLYRGPGNSVCILRMHTLNSNGFSINRQRQSYVVIFLKSAEFIARNAILMPA